MLAIRWHVCLFRSRSAFVEASAEDKISSREALLARNAQPLVPVPKAPGGVKQGKKVKNVMRKNMNLLFDELLTDNKDCVYVGEDVEHGGETPPPPFLTCFRVADIRLLTLDS